MAEGTHRVEGGHPNGVLPAHDLEHEVDNLRVRLDQSLAEFDRRRHEWTDVKLQLRRHPAIPLTAGALFLAFVGGIAFIAWRSRTRRPVEELVMPAPPLAPSQPRLGDRLLATAATTAVRLKRAFETKPVQAL